jgi:hypothetical protein
VLGERVSEKDDLLFHQLTMYNSVLRTTERTSNLAVIFIGGGLSALLVYSIGTELFSKNSPTVLYNDACERIKASPKVSSIVCFEMKLDLYSARLQST